jgi:hypothetical protein
LKKYGKIVREKERKKVREKCTWKKVREKVRKKKEDEKKEVREKKYGKIRGKSKGKSHVTSGDVTSGQTCAMVRSSESSTWILHKCGLSCTHILLVGLQVCLTELIFD